MTALSGSWKRDTFCLCGFRQGRSTIDHLARLESHVRNTLIKREHSVAIFFDLEKAYDTTWKYGILKDLHGMGLRGNLPVFISSFISNRFFSVKVGSSTSHQCEQEMGVPQGSILSVTLFNIKINSLTRCINNNISGSLYVDDLLLCCSGSNMRSIERQLQLCLKQVHQWSVENGFKF